MSEKKGLFGLFGKKKEEDKKVEAPKKDLAGSSSMAELDKARAETLLKQKEMMAEAKKVQKHVVASGETLSAIAKQYYNDAGKYMAIYEANKAVIGDNPDLIQPGMELVIPKL